MPRLRLATPAVALALGAIGAFASLALPATAPAYVLDAATGPFTNPPVGGVGAVVPVTGSATVGNPLVAQLWAASVRYWGGTPKSCARGVRIAMTTDDPDFDGDDTYSGYVYDQQLCTMYLNVADSEWPPTPDSGYSWCLIVAHEEGHMLGLDHSDDERNLMYGDGVPDADPECNAFALDGSITLPLLDDPFYDATGRRRTDAERAAYLQSMGLTPKHRTPKVKRPVKAAAQRR
jgi:hypothetical protein